MTVGDGGALEFWRPDGARLRDTPERSAPVEIAIENPPMAWDGARFDVAYAVDVLWSWTSRPVADVDAAGSV